MNKTIYISDLDGTLLGSDSRISDRSAEIISELSRRGALISVATARTPATVVPLLAQTYTRPDAIVMTGAAFWNRSRNNFDEVHLMPENDVVQALECCRRMDVHPFVYTMRPDEPFMDVYHGAATMNRAEESFYQERCHLRFKRFHTGTPLPPTAIDRTVLMFAMGPTEHVEAVAAGLKAHTDCSVGCYPDIFIPDVSNLEIFAPGVSKARAALELKQNWRAERLVVFGDNLNDLPMFAVADVAVAVGNALDAVKDAANVVIEPNYTDSVARFIQQDFEKCK